MQHVPTAGTIARNALCPCGSGKKYKLCCLTKARSQPATLPANGSTRQALEIARALHQQGDVRQAATYYQQVLAQEPNNADALNLLGITAAQEGQFELAILFIGKAIALSGYVPDYYRNLAVALRDHGDITGAVAALQNGLRHCSGDVPLGRLLGELLYALGDLAGAAEVYRAVLQRTPVDAVALRNLGNILAAQNDTDGALRLYREAISLAPGDPNLYNNLGLTLVKTRKFAEACTAFRDLLRLKPDSALAQLNMAHTQQHLGEWDGLEDRWSMIRAATFSRSRDLLDPSLFLTVTSSGTEQLLCAQNWISNHAAALAAVSPSDFAHRRAPRERLHIGYLSSDFREHLVAHVIADLLERHDRAGFTVSAYSIGPDDRSAMRSRIAGAVDRFVDLANCSDQAAAERIHADGVDILLDLNGYLGMPRLKILAQRPAPIQVNCVGYPGTMGAPFIDYIVVDPFLVQPEHAQQYSERLAYLPDTYLPHDATRVLASGTSLRPSFGLPEDGFVFCCFNQAYKIAPTVFAVWMRLLNAAPGSVLWLKGTNDKTVANLRRHAERAGVDPRRLIFAPWLSSPEHLAAHRLADLFLDTLPFNAHTTASDALWAGLPILTCSGEAFASRVAGSLLHAAGLPELVTTSLEEYEQLALTLAREPARLAELRSRLAAGRETAPLFDGVRYVRNLEVLYRKMWNEFCRTSSGAYEERTPLTVAG